MCQKVLRRLLVVCFQHEGAYRQHEGRHRRKRAHGEHPGEPFFYFREDSAQHAAPTQQTHPAVTVPLFLALL